MKYCEIGNIKIKKTAVLAPMASVSDTAYRLIQKEWGAAFSVSEMISAKALCYNDKKTASLCCVTPPERPFALQLFGSEPKSMSKAAVICARFSPDIIDINMGCPVPKVVKTGAGAALMKNIPLARDILSAVKSVTDIPVTVKIRKGYDDESVNAAEFAYEMEKAGASAITVHGRTRRQLYSGCADWNIIRLVKQNTSVPIIGNGDVSSLRDCINMYEQTGCDLVMIGRASCGNPFIFKEIEAYFEGLPYIQPSLNERLETMRRHIMMIFEHKGEKTGILEARKHAAWYIKGLYGSAALRAKAYSMSSPQDFEDFFNACAASRD